MKTKLYLIIAIFVLNFFGGACKGGFMTPHISSFNFYKNNDNQPTTTFDWGDSISAIVEVSNARSIYKIKYKLFYENVPNRGKGQEAASRETDIGESGQIQLLLGTQPVGEYKVEIILSDEKGTEIDKKSEAFAVKFNQ